MHRLIVSVALLLLMLDVPIFAQEDEEPLPPPRSHMQSKIGGGIGFTQNLLFLNIDPINASLPRTATQFDKVPIVLLGGEGYGYILVVPNLRVGGLGASGSMSTLSVDTQRNISRNVNVSVGFGGVTVGYVVPVVPRLDVAFGMMLGAGNLTITMRRDEGTAKVWGTLWNQFGDTGAAAMTSEYTRKLTGTFFTLQPSVNVEYAVLRWLGLRLGIAYNGMIGNNWELDGNDQNPIAGVPSDVSGKGWMINGGIFLGTFLF